jgi:hypothetical protein
MEPFVRGKRKEQALQKRIAITESEVAQMKEEIADELFFSQAEGSRRVQTSTAG